MASALSSSAIQNALARVAIQGEPGSNSHMAARRMLGPEAGNWMLTPCRISAEVLERVVSHGVDCAVLPIENSLHGSVSEHYDLLLDHPVRITGELELRIEHNVIAAPGTALSEVRRVLSHPVALAQCRRWLRAHPEIEPVPFYDTAGGVREVVSQGLRDAAALAPRLAAEVYGGEILQAGVEDHRENYTRFYRLVHSPEEPVEAESGADKLSLGFSLEHRPGTLLRALGAFEREGMNLTRIESRPVPGRPWEYVFFADARFERRQAVQALLHQLRQGCEMVRVLGLYRAHG